MESPLSKKDAVLLISRALALYLLFWAVTDLLLLPGELNSIIHHLRDLREPVTGGNTLGSETYFHHVHDYQLRFYLFSMFATVARIAAWILAAGWFYRCGPRVQHFFLSSPEQEEPISRSTPPVKPTN